MLRRKYLVMMTGPVTPTAANCVAGGNILFPYWWVSFFQRTFIHFPSQEHTVKGAEYRSSWQHNLYESGRRMIQVLIKQAES
jgi:hypothetical protein